MPGSALGGAPLVSIAGTVMVVGFRAKAVTESVDVVSTFLALVLIRPATKSREPVGVRGRTQNGTWKIFSR
jgi:hypothetical protein